MEELTRHIESLKAAFSKLQPLTAENQQRLDKKMRLEWNYNSNHIEGNTLTYGETELLLIFDQTKGNHQLREYEEMKSHDVALQLIYDLAEDADRELTEKFIREINQVLLVRPFYKEAITPDGQSTRRLIKIGEYKSFHNSVRLANGEIFEYASPSETAALMNDLMNWYQAASNDNLQHPIEVAAELHYRFVRIHPFDDGNGRISRLLMNYHLIKNDLPPAIIKSADKKNYLFALHEADTGNLEAFKKYIGEQLVWSYEVSIKAAKGESVEEQGDWEKKISVLKKQTANNSKLNSQKSKENLLDTIENSFIPLIQNLFFKIQPLEEFYVSSKFYLTLNDQHGVINSNSFTDILKVNSLITEYTYSIYYSHTLNNFTKNGVSTFNSTYRITLRFGEATYTISYKDLSNINTDIEKNYGENLMEDEIEKIISHITDKIYSQIQTNIKQTPLK